MSGWTDDELIAMARKAKLPKYMYDTPSGREALARLLSLRPEAATTVGKHVGYINERGNIMTIEEYERHRDTPAWKWVIDQHWTPVAPVYAGEFGYPCGPQPGERLEEQ